MPDDLLPQAFAQLFAVYGPAAIPIVGLLLVIKYLLDERRQTAVAHKEEIAAERAKIAEERERVQALQDALLKEARGNAQLAESVNRALEALARRKD